MSAFSDLGSELRRIAAGYSGKVTFALTDIASGQHIGLNEDDVMPTASLIKVPILVALYQAAYEGRLALDDRIQLRDEHRFPGSGVLQHMASGAEMTVRDAAVLMIIISDNAATNMVADLLGREYINQCQRSIGCAKTSVFQRWSADLVGLDSRQTWVSTAAEMARNFELITRHEAVSDEASEDMLRILRRNDGRAELSRRLPWDEMNRLPDHRRNWVAEKGGSSPGGIRTGGAVFHGARGSFVMAAFCEGGAGAGAGRSAEGNLLLGDLGYAAWQALAAPP